MDWADGYIQKNKVTSISLVIFTRKYPCEVCQGKILLWAAQYKAKGIDVELAVWYLAPGKGEGVFTQAMYINTAKE